MKGASGPETSPVSLGAHDVFTALIVEQVGF
jgi:hypothetical protein